MKKKELPEIFKKILDTFKNFLNFIGAKLKKFDIAVLSYRLHEL